MKNKSHFTHGLLLTGVILTLLMATLYPVSSALALSPVPGNMTAPQTIEPAANKVLKSPTPTYYWTQVTGATSYELQVLKEYSNAVYYSFTLPAKTYCVRGGGCGYTPTKSLEYYGYRWRVKVSGTTTWSPLVPFYIRAKDVDAHHFTYELMYHWQRKSGGTWWAQYNGGVTGYLVSEGLPDKCSAAVHYVSSTYDNFIFETRVKITGAPSGGKYPEAYLALRMKNKVDPLSQCWYGGYLFGYSLDGKYSFWRMESNGAWTALIPPTYSKDIKTTDWNTIKVYMLKNSFSFEINGKYVGNVTDSTYSIGYFGYEMVNHGSAPTKFYADWIKIQPLP